MLAATRAAGTVQLSGVTAERLSASPMSSSASTSSTLRRLLFEVRFSGSVDFTTHRLEEDSEVAGHPSKHVVQIGHTDFVTAFHNIPPSHHHRLLPSHLTVHAPVGLLGGFAYLEPYTPYDPLATPSATAQVKAGPAP
ncbi:MAG: hypothetical protein ACRDY3_08885 [Acidimicrobiales bacterium]